MTEEERRACFEAILRASPTLMRVLALARDLDLPDWLLAAGSIYQSVWNAVTAREPDYGVKDYDLAYFDPDPSWAAEDAVICRAAAAFPPPLSQKVEVRNQGRVHLWFEGKFGEPYSPLANTAEMVERFVCPAFAVGVRLMGDDALHVVAPFGLGDVFDLVLRPNPRRLINTAGFQKVAASCRGRWPEVKVQM